MVKKSELQGLAEGGKRAFAAGQYRSAADMFQTAARGYAQLNDQVNAAELNNNLSVALLKAGQPRAALDAARGTDEIFAGVRDVRRQGMAVGNQAAALEEIGRLDEALAAYERSAELLAEAGEADMRSLMLKAAAGIQLRRGQIADSGIRMLGALESKQHPSLMERVLKFLLRITPH